MLELFQITIIRKRSSTSFLVVELGTSEGSEWRSNPKLVRNLIDLLEAPYSYQSNKRAASTENISMPCFNGRNKLGFKDFFL